MTSSIKEFARFGWDTANIWQRIALALPLVAAGIDFSIEEYGNGVIMIGVFVLYASCIVGAGRVALSEQVIAKQDELIATLREEIRDMEQFVNLFDLVRAEPPTDG